MVYLLALRKYVFLFLKTALFFAIGLLLYLFTMLVYYKFKGESAVLIEALKNYALFVIYSIPFITLVASCFYFGFIGNDKKFILRIIPIIAGFNTIILLIFFLMKIDFLVISAPTQLYFNPGVEEGYINTIGEYKVYIDKNKAGAKKGILFYKNAYLVNDYSIRKNDTSVSTYQVIGRGEIYSQNGSFSLPRKAPVIQLRETGIAHWFIQNYIGYLKKLREIFYTTFVDGGIPVSVIAILLLSVGYFAVACGISSFINDKQIMILSYATLFGIAGLLFLVFPHFLSLIALIKFGIKIGFLRVIIPSLFVGLFAGLIGYALLELRLLLLKNTGKR